MPTKDTDYNDLKLEKACFIENNKDEAEDLLIIAIRGEIIRLHEVKSKRRQQRIRDFVSKSYEQLIKIREMR